MDICRACMEEVEDYVSIFHDMEVLNKTFSPAVLITELSGIPISRNDGLPEHVCCGCLQEIVQAYTIRNRCIASDRKLRKILFFQHHGKRLVTEKSEPDKTIDHDLPDEEVSVKVSQIDKDIDRINDCISENLDNDRSVETTQIEICTPEPDGFVVDSKTVDNKAAPAEEAPSFTMCESYVKQRTCENDGKTIKIESEASKASFLFVEYLEETVEPHEEEISETANSYETIPLDNGTIEMEVEIVKPQHHGLVRIESDSVAVSNADEREVKKFVCDLCKQDFSTKGNLKSHLMLHNNERPYVCEICGRKFSKKSNYNVHLSRHSNSRNYPCTACDKSFVCHINLKNHMRKHTGERPYACQYCDKSFMYLSDINRHRYIHTGDYPFKCELCAKQFARASLLKQHLQGKCPVKYGANKKRYSRKKE